MWGSYCLNGCWTSCHVICSHDSEINVVLASSQVDRACFSMGLSQGDEWSGEASEEEAALGAHSTGMCLGDRPSRPTTGTRHRLARSRSHDSPSPPPEPSQCESQGPSDTGTGEGLTLGVPPCALSSGGSGSGAGQPEVQASSQNHDSAATTLGPANPRPGPLAGLPLTDVGHTGTAKSRGQ